MKKILLPLLMLITVSAISAGGFGESFGGSMAGSFIGSSLGTAVTHPRQKTVIVQQRGDDDRVRRLEDQIREDRIRHDDEIRNLKKRHRDEMDELERRYEKRESKRRRTDNRGWFS